MLRARPLRGCGRGKGNAELFRSNRSVCVWKMGGREKKAWKNWLCHFWRSLLCSDQEGKNDVPGEKLHAAEAFFLCSVALSSCSIAWLVRRTRDYSHEERAGFSRFPRAGGLGGGSRSVCFIHVLRC